MLLSVSDSYPVFHFQIKDVGSIHFQGHSVGKKMTPSSCSAQNTKIKKSSHVISCSLQDTQKNRVIRCLSYLTGSEAWEHLDTGLLSLLAQPLDIVAQGDDVVALVVHLRRVGKRDRVVLGEELHLIMQSGLVQWSLMGKG